MGAAFRVTQRVTAYQPRVQPWELGRSGVAAAGCQRGKRVAAAEVADQVAFAGEPLCDAHPAVHAVGRAADPARAGPILGPGPRMVLPRGTLTDTVG